ncbi:MAG TPA: hypothetical protein VER98_07275 [Terriglobia bacterium]|nr:hypothetical protein [Terriglobia bacterium]
MKFKYLSIPIISFLIAGFASAEPLQDAAPTSYLPLAEGAKWVLRQEHSRQAVTIEVTGREKNAFRLMFTSPWNKNQWQLTPRDGKYFMTGYGTADAMMPLPDDTLFFDFTAPSGRSWSAATGKMTVNNKGVMVRTSAKNYSGCIQITQAPKGSSFVYTFAPNVGFVKFELGGMTFLLDESSSKLASAPPDTKTSQPAAPPARDAARTSAKKLAVGVTTTTFPSESDTPENLLKRFQQTADAGIGYISGAGKWTEFEPSKGQYKFDSLNFQSGLAQNLDIPMSYTLRMIDTVTKMVPPDLAKKSWNDPEMRNRALRLVEGLAPYLKGRVQWFMFGNEIDGYFMRHPNEVADFVELYKVVQRRLKELVPGIQVTSTVMFGGIDDLKGRLKALDGEFDFLSITYYPTNPDFTVKDPSVPAHDFDRMREAARGRKVVLQEIGYPTSPINKSSEDKQAEFFDNIFKALRANNDFVAAASFFLLADLRDQTARDLTQYYGITNAPTFRAFLQTLGMFDGHGKAKKSWAVFERELKR